MAVKVRTRYSYVIRIAAAAHHHSSDRLFAHIIYEHHCPFLKTRCICLIQIQCKPVSDSGIFMPIFTYIAAIYARLYQNDRFKQKLDE